MINPKNLIWFKKSKNIALFLEENILTHCVVLEVAAAAWAAIWLFLLLGGGIGEAAEAVLITEVNVSSNTSNGLLGLSSKGVSRSTLPESTLESRLWPPPALMELEAAVVVLEDAAAGTLWVASKVELSSEVFATPQGAYKSTYISLSFFPLEKKSFESENEGIIFDLVVLRGYFQFFFSRCEKRKISLDFPGKFPISL